MITLSESGLSPTEYNLLNKIITDPAYQIFLYRSNLIFENYKNLPDADTKVFDATILGGDLLIVYDGVLYRIDGDDQSIESVAAPGSTWYSLRGSKLYTISGGAIQERTISTGPLAISSPTTIGTSSPTVMSSVSDGRLYYFNFEPTKRLYQLCWIGADGNGQSDLYWQYPIQSMDAIRMPDGVTDVIVFATQAPGTLRVQNDGTELYKTIEFAGGIFAVTCKDNIVSDPVEVDAFDHMGGTRFRRDVRITFAHGQLVATAYSSTGRSKVNPVRGYRYYVSRTGIHWSLGHLLPLPESVVSRGVKPLFLGDDFFIASPGMIYRSDCTIHLGHAAPSTKLDLTNEVIEYKITQEKMLQADVTFANEDQSLTNSAFFSGSNTYTIAHYWGTWNVDQRVLVLLGYTDVDYYSYEYGHRSALNLVGRDWLHRLTDFSQSEEAKYGEGQLQGGDTYSDETNTNYGGMRHTAPQRGIWQTPDGTLQLYSNNEEGAAFSTFSPYIWNGAYRISFNISKPGNDEYAGIVFRGIDFQNLWMAIYQESDDKIHVIRRVDGNPTTFASSAAMDWSGNTNRRHIAVWFYLGKLKVYTSADGIAWTVTLDLLLPGEHPADTRGPLVMDRGFVGVIGKGFAPEIKWEWPEFNWPSFYYEPLDLDFDINLDLPNWDEYTYQKQDPRTANHALAWNASGSLLITNNFYSNDPIWRQSLTQYVQGATFRNDSSLEAYAIINTGSSLILKHNPDVNTDDWEDVVVKTSVGAYTSAVASNDLDVAYMYQNGTHTKLFWKKQDDDWVEITLNTATELSGRHCSLRFMPNGNLVSQVWKTNGGALEEKSYRLCVIDRATNAVTFPLDNPQHWGIRGSTDPIPYVITRNNEIIASMKYHAANIDTDLGTAQGFKQTLSLPGSTDYSSPHPLFERRVNYFQNNRYTDPAAAFVLLGPESAPTMKIDTRTDVGYTYSIGFEWFFPRPMPIVNDVISGNWLSWTAVRNNNAKIGTVWGTARLKTYVEAIDGTEYVTERYWDQSSGTYDYWMLTSFGGPYTESINTAPPDTVVSKVRMEVTLTNIRTNGLSQAYFTIGSPQFRPKPGWQFWNIKYQDAAWRETLNTPLYFDPEYQLFIPYGRAYGLDMGHSLIASNVNPSFFSGSRKLTESIGTGQVWNTIDPGVEYSGIHVVAGTDQVLTWAQNRLELQPFFKTRAGNIEDIWGLNWTPVGVDTSTGTTIVLYNTDDEYDPI